MKNSRTLKIGDIVRPFNYCGEMIIVHKDEDMSKLLGESQWFCTDVEYDTNFDTYGESELTLLE